MPLKGRLRIVNMPRRLVKRLGVAILQLGGLAAITVAVFSIDWRAGLIAAGVSALLIGEAA